MLQTDCPASFPPRAFVIGAQKAATTTFAEALGQHPSLLVSTPKEPHFFTTNWHRGLEWYRECFSGGNAGMLVDASTSYTLCPFPGHERPDDPIVGTPERIARISPEARFIYLLRDPAARAYSAYWHAVRRGWETRPLAAAVTEESSYVAGSSYVFQLGRYLEIFPNERFMLIQTDAFLQDPQRVLEQCVSFLGIDVGGFAFRPPSRRNRSFGYSALGRRLIDAIGGEQVAKRINLATRPLLPNRLRDIIERTLTTDVPTLDAATRAMIEERMDPGRVDVTRLKGIEIVR